MEEKDNKVLDIKVSEEIKVNHCPSQSSTSVFFREHCGFPLKKGKVNQLYTWPDMDEIKL